MTQVVEIKQNGCSTVKFEKEITISVVTKNVKAPSPEPQEDEVIFDDPTSTSTIYMILCGYFSVFALAFLILLLAIVRLYTGGIDGGEVNEKINSKNLSSYKSFNNINSFKDFRNFSDSNLNSVFNINSSFSKNLFKEYMLPFRSSTINCSQLGEVKKFNYLKSGWTKNVFSFEYNGKHYALKIVNANGEDMTSCMQNHTSEICFKKATSKIFKEYVLSRELSHLNIIQAQAWCVSSKFLNNFALITELCTPLDIIKLLRMSFAQRLKIIVDLSQVVAFLAKSPIGSIAIGDFQMQQFVLCGDTLKLTDLDDLSFEEPKCNSHKQCSQKSLIEQLKLNKNFNSRLELKCINNFCLGYNERQNVMNAYKHFVNLFLNIKAPVALKKDVEALLDIYTSTWDGKAVLKQTKFLYFRFKNLKNTDGWAT